MVDGGDIMVLNIILLLPLRLPIIVLSLLQLKKFAICCNLAFYVCKSLETQKPYSMILKNAVLLP